MDVEQLGRHKDLYPYVLKEAIMNGDAIIQRLAQRIAQLIAENEILKQELLEIKEANDGECKQDTES